MFFCSIDAVTIICYAFLGPPFAKVSILLTVILYLDFKEPFALNRFYAPDFTILSEASLGRVPTLPSLSLIPKFFYCLPIWATKHYLELTSPICSTVPQLASLYKVSVQLFNSIRVHSIPSGLLIGSMYAGFRILTLKTQL